jgi:flagellar motor switch protein FliG
MGVPADGLRKAAILIDSLEENDVESLLDQMPCELAGSIRQAVLELSSVDPQERERVLRELRECVLSADEDEDNDADVELDESLAEKLAGDELDEAYETADDEPAVVPFSFLNDAPIDVLSSYLEDEHPQAVSVVLASLAPRQAAELLRCLPEERKRDVLNRLARLDEMNSEVVREIEQGLRSLLAGRPCLAEQRPAGLAAVEAILEAADEEHRGELIKHLATSEHASMRTDSTQAARSEVGRSHASTATSHVYHSRVPTSQVQQRVGNLLHALSAPQHANGRTAGETDSTGRGFKQSETALEFDDFAQLNDTALARVFRAAAPQVTLVALCGASRDLVNRILGSLPLREARALRGQIERLGPTRLRDIESAQLQLAALARQMADEGRIQVPPERRFVAAV